MDTEIEIEYEVRHAVELEDAPEFIPAGTGDEWREHVGKLCVGNSRMLFAASLTFAAPLLHPMKIEPGAIHLFGDSSIGKSAIFHAAASIKGLPHPQGIICQWNTTAAAAEAMAALHNHGAFFLDELGQCSAEAAGRLAYSLTAGEGKRRANQFGGLRDAHQYTVLLLSNGEFPFADHLRKGGVTPAPGQEIRIADVPADAGEGMGAFEQIHGSTSPAVFADRVKQAAGEYHGTVFLDFIDELVDDVNLDFAGFSERVNTYMKSFFNTAVGVLPPGSGQIHRVATRFALIAAGGELATHYGVTGWEKGDALWGAHVCYNAWLSRRGTHGNLEVHNLEEQVRAFFNAHGESRFTPLDGDQKKGAQRTINRAGWSQANVDVITGASTTDYYVTTSAFREMIGGGDSTSAANKLVLLGIIRPGPKGTLYTSKKIPNEGSQRVYHFPPREETDGETAE